jgi:hypothetical protein
LQGFRNGAAEGPDQEYARICADMQRFGNFGAEVPEIMEGGFIPPRPRSESGGARCQAIKSCRSGVIENSHPLREHDLNLRFELFKVDAAQGLYRGFDVLGRDTVNNLDARP